MRLLTAGSEVRVLSETFIMSRSFKEKIIYEEKLNIPYNYLKFATPREVSLYRSERLANFLKKDVNNSFTLLEIGAGIGGQTLAFSKFFKKVISIEIDKSKTNILKNNLKKLKINNVEIINGDALNKSIINKLSSYKIDIIFVDTERPENSERTLGNIHPPITALLKNYFKISKNITIEIPPFTKNLDLLKKEYSFEEEFISLNKTLNRLTLYFNGLKKYEKSCVSLPSKELVFLEDNEKKTIKEISSLKNFNFLYVIDESLILSDLYWKFAKRFDLFLLNLDKKVFVSKKLIKSAFLTSFKIKSFVKGDENSLVIQLKKINAKKIVLRYNIDPKEYWDKRKELENKINLKNNMNNQNNKEFHLFFNPKEKYYLICEKIIN